MKVQDMRKSFKTVIVIILFYSLPCTVTQISEHRNVLLPFFQACTYQYFFTSVESFAEVSAPF